MVDGERSFGEHVAYHLVDTTAMLAVATPAFACLETLVSGMSVEVSQSARIVAAGLMYGGAGYAVSRGRKMWRFSFGVSDSTSEGVQQFHDMAYVGSFNLLFSPALYLMAGSRDLKEIAIGTAMAVGFGVLCGGVMGYSVDLYGDLVGLKESHRTPGCIKSQVGHAKKGIAILLTAISLAITAGVYQVVDRVEPSRIENVVGR